MSNKLCEICIVKNKEIAKEQKRLSKGMRRITIKIVGTDSLIVNRFGCRIIHNFYQ